MLKRGTKIEYTFAAGKVVQGKVVKPQPVPFYGKPGIDLWYVVKLADDSGVLSDKAVSVHYGQVRNIDNRPAFR
ncbi:MULTISPECIES: hypothetical protein [unclassified Sinorhizobium]|uniref:hypothetical protein n=1 Tax=unclassified Sinorhizobium TaxID=2613772 RepID=UPI003526019A